MDVGTYRLVISVSLQTCAYILKVLRLTPSLRRQPHQFTAGVDNPFCLCHRGVSIIGVGSRHRLHANGIVTTYIERSSMSDGTLPSLIVEQIYH